MKHMRTLLRESTNYCRVVGFGDAVADLGTHRICGMDVHYSKQMVYNVLHGRSMSRKLIARIVERRPDLLDLSFVNEATRDAARRIGWRPGMGMPDWRARERRNCSGGEGEGTASVQQQGGQHED